VRLPELANKGLKEKRSHRKKDAKS